MESVPADLTLLLNDYSAGDRAAFDRLIPLVYNELYRIASGCLSGRDAALLQPTALVNEAWIRLADRAAPELKNRKHFYVVAATIMRQILVDHARARNAVKRGGGAPHADFTIELAGASAAPPSVLALHDALDGLAKFDQRKARILELRFFGGLSVDETADVLGLSPTTVNRDARFAQAWLLSELVGARPA
jgi:RNA polymerase sigma factor (TIGR02999 family)